ncbi:MAG: RtcB family protein [candidate division Zixibacteria bacterium]|nr:RtcB family protein [candidate division Zixibacteria bacterium]MBU1470352.1 RtcB family protein [candidate division Zixibacteria bacterium]MBU2624920.1 RtcB family protein [candidate division Zixibacteria bacterium]
MEKKKISEGIWEIDPSQKQGMNVPARILSSDRLIDRVEQGVYEQITNVACLPGIVGSALCMPDGHWGYGFPIGGVAAFSTSDGIISPGGIGFDINCGMKMLRTNLTLEEIRPKLQQLIDTLFDYVPAGAGKTGTVHLDNRRFRDIMTDGVGWCVKNGFATAADQDASEESGCIRGANPDFVSDKAFKRGLNQLGTLGSGNHYLEIEVVKESNILDHDIARAFGIDRPNQIVISIHCGSRGFGHQVATDYLQVFEKSVKKFGINVRDKELACAPFKSDEGQRYFAAMKCAANNAFANRQVIVHRIREAFEKVLGKSNQELGITTIYDVAHNIAKIEKYSIDGREQEVVVHRKGATRAFGPDVDGIPSRYRGVGQPVIVGGSMETGAYLLVGTQKAMDSTFGSTLHGSGRTMSRMKAKKQVQGKALASEMRQRGILVRAASFSGLAEEAGFAYKNIDDVVDAVAKIGISKPVAKLLPIANIKG